MKRRMFLARAVLAGIAFHLAACSLSTPSPHSGMHNDFTPRLVNRGDMNTRIESNYNPSLNSALQNSAGIAQSFGLKNGRQLDLLLEVGGVEIPVYDSVSRSDVNDVQDVFYLGVQLKNDITLFGKSPRILTASVFGLGMGEYGNYVEFVDAFGGLSLGLNSRYLGPYFALTGGLSLPYRRKFFHSLNTNPVGNQVTVVGKYHYVASPWVLTEYGLESPFGNKERGIRLNFSVSQGFYYMLEEDMVAPYRSEVPWGFEFLYKLGLSWTY